VVVAVVMAMIMPMIMIVPMVMGVVMTMLVGVVMIVAVVMPFTVHRRAGAAAHHAHHSTSRSLIVISVPPFACIRAPPQRGQGA